MGDTIYTLMRIIVGSHLKPNISQLFHPYMNIELS